MWQEIRLRSLGVIESAELSLGPGFTVISGETGAGKTMVVTALGLLRGARSDAGLVRHGDSRATVEASVDVSALPEVATAIEDTPAEVEDDVLLLGRTISKEGRSRAYLGGASVPAGLLASVSDLLVAVHGQSDQHRLLRPAEQRQALDRFGGDAVAEILAAYEPAYARFRRERHRLEEITGAARERARELDVLVFGLEEIAKVDPQPGEDLELAAEEDRLAHAETLATSAARAHALLSADAEVVGDAGASGAVDLLGQAAAGLAEARDHDPALASLSTRLDEAGFVAADIAADLASYAEGVEVDPARLAVVQDRRAALAALGRKYGPELTDVLSWAEDARGRAGELRVDDDRVVELRASVDALGTELLDLAARLSAARRNAAEDLAKRVSAELDALAMPQAAVAVVVAAPDEPSVDALGPHGWDQVELLMSSGPGMPARPLGKGASGGELSRVMLALEVVLADETSVPTFVFDEVDAGIGGKAAVEVGRRLARLARHAQVVAVTHLPQVAAFADRHYQVVKSDDGTVTTSGVGLLDEDARIAELSRMLAGLEGSASAEAHARELIALAEAARDD